MEERKMEIISSLMEELQGLMEPSPDDFSERLGKPKLEVMKVEAEDPMEMEDAGGDMDMAEMMEGSPEDKLKQRLMKLRG